MSHAVGVYLIAQSGSRSNLGAAPQFAFPLYTLFLLRGNGAKERAKVKAGKYADLSKMRDLKEEKQKILTFMQVVESFDAQRKNDSLRKSGRVHL